MGWNRDGNYFVFYRDFILLFFRIDEVFNNMFLELDKLIVNLVKLWRDLVKVMKIFS